HIAGRRVEVNIVDIDTGDQLCFYALEDGYIVVTCGSCQVTRVHSHPGGTAQLTIKGQARPMKKPERYQSGIARTLSHAARNRGK
ncbi:MAG: hypothetical protein H0U67_16620, partial [Gemmatimonadetes bacterium]|nr:hypothetical protein [Gemmatimonadota bacterium]